MRFIVPPNEVYPPVKDIPKVIFGSSGAVTGSRATLLAGSMVVMDGKLYHASMISQRHVATATTSYSYWPKDMMKKRYDQTHMNYELKEINTKDWNHKVIHGNVFIPLTDEKSNILSVLKKKDQ